MKKIFFSFIVGSIFPLSVFAQHWKPLVKQDFGLAPSGQYNSAIPASSTPLVDIQSIVVAGGVITAVNTAYTESIDNSCNDGSFSVTTNPYLVGNFGGTPPWSNALDHTIDASGLNGRMLVINADPIKKGPKEGTYIMYTQSGAVPGSQYRFKFYATNLLRNSYDGSAKNAYLGLGIYADKDGAGVPLKNTTYQFTRSTNDISLNWREVNEDFTLPITYANSNVYFNFYNSDPDLSNNSNGNDIGLDDISIEMMVSELRGKVFMDYNGNGVQDGADFPINGATYPLFAYCVDKNNNITSKIQVNQDGTYFFDTINGIPYANIDIGLKIVISTYDLNIGANLPESYVYNRSTVSENISSSNNPTFLNTGDFNGIIGLNRSDVDLTNVNFGIRPFCYKSPSKSGTVHDTTTGITALNRAGTNTGNWPMERKGAFIVLESKNKGFVINRTQKTDDLINIVNPLEGMIVYDEEAACLKLYTIKDGETSLAWHCIVEQTCPE